MRHKVTRVIDSKGQFDRSLHAIFQFWSAICKRSSALPRRWWRHDIGTSSAILALCVGNPPAIVESSLEVPELCSFKVLCGSSTNKPLHKQSSCHWFETPWHPCGVIVLNLAVYLVSTSYKIMMTSSNGNRSPLNSPHKGQWRGCFLWSAPNKWLSKQSRRRSFKTPSCSL